jgi:hypothetical protein
MHALELVENLWTAPQRGATIMVLTGVQCTNLVHFLGFGMSIFSKNSFFIQNN